MDFPYDRGWAWLVVAGCFGMHSTVSALTKAMGIILPDIQAMLGGSYWALASMHGTALALFLGTAPLSNALSIRFSHRLMVFFGGLLGLTGLCSASLTTTLSAFYFFAGIVTGLGFGFAYGPSIVITLHYFKKKRGLALGVAQSGAGFGGMLMPLLVRYLTNEYGLRGSLIIQGAIMANVCVFAMLYRPLSFYKRYAESVVLVAEPLDKPQIQFKSDSIFCDNSGKDKTDSIIISNTEETLSNGNISEYYNRIRYHANDASSEVSFMTNKNIVPPDISQSSISIQPNSVTLNSAHIHSIKHITNSNRLPLQSPPLHGGRISHKSTIVSKIHKYFNWRILTNVRFLCYLLASIGSEVTWETAFIMLPSLAEFKNYSKLTAMWLPAILGITDLFFRIFAGFVVDYAYIKNEYLFLCSVILTGVTAVCAPFTTSFTALAVTAGFYGVLGALNIVIAPILFTEILGIENISTAFGISTFLQAVCIAITSQIVGYLFDLTGNWTMSFVCTGIMSLSTGTIALLQAVVHSHRTSEST